MSSMGSPRRLRSKLHSSSKSELRGSDPSSLGDWQRYGDSGRCSKHQNGSEKLSERLRKAKIGSGGKSGRQQSVS